MAACNFLEIPNLDPPNVPDGYPAIDRHDAGTAELSVGGIAVRDTAFTAGSEDKSGADLQRLRVSLGFDKLDLEFHHADPREYTVAAGELEGQWYETESMSADTDCGSGKVTVVGTRDVDDRDERLMWGLIQLELCDYEKVQRLDISGRFSMLYMESD